jgi:hypothetical protein
MLEMFLCAGLHRLVREVDEFNNDTRLAPQYRRAGIPWYRGELLTRLEEVQVLRLRFHYLSRDTDRAGR